jgi:hypothetical protein
MARSLSRILLRSALTGAVLLVSPAFAGGITVTEKDAGKSVSVASGEPLTVRLPGIRGKGFWRLDTDVSPELVLSGRKTESVLAPNAPETTVFTFASRTPGTVTLKASYVTSGGDITPADRFAVLVTVSQP